MKAWLTLIGTFIGGLVFLTRWYLSPEQTKKRAIKDDKNAMEKYDELFEKAAKADSQSRYVKRDMYLHDLREHWIDSLQAKNKADQP